MTIKAMKNYRSFPIQLSEVKSGEEFPNEVQLLKVGTFKDPRYGDFNVTPKMLGEMVSNFKKGVRGIKPALDFSHKTEDEAAAWMLDVYTKDNGETLWFKPDWTGPGRRCLADKSFGYISADFSTNYRDNEKGELHGCVLLGAALTNRPVIKGMQPVIQLSEGELMFNEEDLKKLQALMQSMGISDITALMAKIAEMNKAPSELSEANKQLSEKKGELTKAQEKITTLEAEVVELKKGKELSENEKKFNVMLSEGKVCEAQRDPFLKNDLVKFAELAVKGGVKTTTNGTQKGKEQDDVELDDQDEILKLAEEKVSKKEFDNIGDAISAVMREQKASK